MGRTMLATASGGYRRAACKPDGKWGSGKQEGKMLSLSKQEQVTVPGCPDPLWSYPS